MDSFKDLDEKIGHVDRPHTIEDLNSMLSDSQELNEFIYALKGIDWRTDEEIRTPYPDLAREFDVDKVSPSEFRWALKSVKGDYYDRMSNPVVLYRYVGGDPNDVDEEDLGHCWARDSIGIITYLKNQQDYLGSSRKLFSGSDRPCGTVFVGKTTLDNIDWIAEALLSIWGWDSSERELRVWDTSKVEIVQKKTYTSREMDSILSGLKSFGLDEVDVEYGTSGETQPFSWFKDMRDSDRKVHYVFYNVFQGKEVDEDWFYDKTDELSEEYLEEHGYDAYSELVKNGTMLGYLIHRSNVSEEERNEAMKKYDSLISLGNSMSEEKADSVNWQETLLNYLYGKEEVAYKK